MEAVYKMTDEKKIILKPIESEKKEKVNFNVKLS